MGRTWHRGLLFQSEDYGQVAAMRFSLLAQPPPLPSDLFLPCNRNRHRWCDGGDHPFANGIRKDRRALRRRPLRKGGDSA
jgi:hypothetical protein